MVLVAGGSFSALFFIWGILQYMVVLPKYSYEEDFIKLAYLNFTYKKVKYMDYQKIVISNASLHVNGTDGTSMPEGCPVGFKIKTAEGKKVYIRYPYISLHKEHRYFKDIKAGMSIYQIHAWVEKSAFYLGICWFDSFAELLRHTDMEVYILEDVYLRFQRAFDSILIPFSNIKNRFYIVKDVPIPYQMYGRTKVIIRRNN